MPTAMTRWAISGVLCLLLSAGAARAQALVSRVPADAVAYLGWQGADSPTNGYSGSRLEAIVNSSNLPLLGEDFLPQVLAKMTAKNGDNGDGARFLHTLLGILWRHSTAIYFSGMTTAPDGSPIPKLGVLCQAGEDAETLSTLLNGVVQSSPPQKMLRVIESGDVTAFTSGYDENEMPLANDPQQVGEVANRPKAIGDDPDFGRVQKQVSAQPLVFGYFDTTKLLGVVDQMVENGEDEHAKDVWPKVRDASGILGLKHLAFSAGFQGRDWQTQAFAEAPLPRIGLLGLLDAQPIDPALLARIPATAVFAQVFQFDVGRLVSEVRKVVAAAIPDGAANFDKGAAILQLFIGRNPRTDIINPLGSQWAVYNDPSLSDKPMLNTIVVNKLKDPNKAHGGWEMLWFAAKNLSAPFIRKKHLPISLTDSSAGDLTIHIVETPVAKPSWTMSNDFLYFGLSPQAVAAAAKYAAEGFSSNTLFPPMEKQLLGDAPARGFGFSNLPATAASAYPELLSALSKLNELLAAQDLHLPDKLLPPLEKILPQLTPAAHVSWADDLGLHYKALTPFPGAQFLSPRPLDGAGGINQAVLSSTVLAPALAKARNQANAAKSANNLQQIGHAVLLYAAKNNGALPPDLQTLSKAGMLDASLISDPSGEPYVYTGSGQNIVSLADPSKQIIAHQAVDVAVDGKVEVLYADGHVDARSTADATP